MVSVLLGDAPVAERWEELGDRQPPITPHESRLAAQACREDPEFLAALARRGIDDASLVMIDAESIGGFVPERHAGRRVAWGATWHREDVADNGYARPVEGVVPIIDLDTLEVLEVEDHGVVPMATERGTFAPGEWGERPGLTPLEIVQPEGASFTVDGWAVSWQGWELRVGFDHREGLVLHDLRFLGPHRSSRARVGERDVRPVPRPDAHAVPQELLRLGRVRRRRHDELARARLRLPRPHPLLRRRGRGRRRQPCATSPTRSACTRRTTAILWKHTNGRTRRRRGAPLPAPGHLHVRHRRRTTTTASSGRSGRTARSSSRSSSPASSPWPGIAVGERPLHGRAVGPGVQAATHQHYFAVRLDTAVDGPRNRLVGGPRRGRAGPGAGPARQRGALRPHGAALRARRRAARRSGARRALADRERRPRATATTSRPRTGCTSTRPPGRSRGRAA